MRLTGRSEVALKAMIELARLGPNAPHGATAAELAERCSSTVSYVEQVLASLRIGRLVVSRRGRRGGYRLARGASNIAIGEVLRVIDGPLGPAPCSWPGNNEACSWCSPGPPCSLASLWVEVAGAISDILETRTLADIASTDAVPEAQESPFRNAAQSH